MDRLLGYKEVQGRNPIQTNRLRSIHLALPHQDQDRQPICFQRLFAATLKALNV